MCCCGCGSFSPFLVVARHPLGVAVPNRRWQRPNTGAQSTSSHSSTSGDRRGALGEATKRKDGFPPGLLVVVQAACLLLCRKAGEPPAPQQGPATPAENRKY